MAKVNIYVDMDGVQAVYGFGDSVEEMSRPGYFRHRPMHENVIELMKLLRDAPEFEVYVLSAVFADDHSEADKRAWLDACGLNEVQAVFVPYGENKGDYVSHEGFNILIDDFSENLVAWERLGKNFVGVKFLNEGNGTRGSWFRRGGFSVNYNMSSEKILAVLQGIAHAEAAA